MHAPHFLIFSFVSLHCFHTFLIHFYNKYVCCGWWLIYVVDFWLQWWSGGLMFPVTLVAQVTTLQLVVEQWRSIVVRPGWPDDGWDILLYTIFCVVYTPSIVLACHVRRLGIIGVSFPDHWSHCVTVQHPIPISFPDHQAHCYNTSYSSLIPRPPSPLCYNRSYSSLISRPLTPLCKRGSGYNTTSYSTFEGRDQNARVISFQYNTIVKVIQCWG